VSDAAANDPEYIEKKKGRIRPSLSLRHYSQRKIWSKVKQDDQKLVKRNSCIVKRTEFFFRQSEPFRNDPYQPRSQKCERAPEKQDREVDNSTPGKKVSNSFHGHFRTSALLELFAPILRLISLLSQGPILLLSGRGSFLKANLCKKPPA
jgi:hypothetical protein